MNKKSLFVIVIFVSGIFLSACSVSKKVNSSLTKEERFTKDEYCKKTYAESFISNYEMSSTHFLGQFVYSVV